MTTAPELSVDAEAFASVEPATGRLVATFPVHRPPTCRPPSIGPGTPPPSGATSGGRGAGRAWTAGRACWPAGPRELAALVHRENGKPVADARLEITLAVDHIAWAAKHAPQGARSPQGAERPDDGEPGGHAGVPAAGCRRRHRALELPGVHPDGLDRLRPRGRQRRGVQALRAHPGHREVARRHLRRGGAGAPGLPAASPAAARPERRCAGRASTRSPSPAVLRPAARSWPCAPRRSPPC